MPVREIITAATYTPAQALRVDQKTGSIEAGKLGDPGLHPPGLSSAGGHDL